MRQSRQALVKGEIRDDDFKAYLASDQPDDAGDSEGDGEDDDGEDANGEARKGRGRLLALLNMDDGGSAFDSKGSKRGGKASKGEEEEDREMQITFLPGLSEAAAKRIAKSKDDDEETTLERYKRKDKAKKEARKEARLKKLRGEDSASEDEEEQATKPAKENGHKNVTFDDPFSASGDDEEVDFDAALEEELASEAKSKSKDSKKGGKKDKQPTKAAHAEPEQMETVADRDAAPAEGVGHFDMKDILRKEKGEGKKASRFEKRKEKKAAKLAAARGGDIKEEALQEDFKVNPADARFKAMFDDHSFAIDPSHKSFLKTKAMEEILNVKRKAAAKQLNEAPPPGKEDSPDLLSLARKLKKRGGESGRGHGAKKQRVA